MFKHSLAVGLIAVAALAMPSAYGSTIDTFSFTESNWDYYSFPTGVGGPTPGGTLIGSFTGVVEADGFIEQGDLSAFSAHLFPFAPTIGRGSLTLFSYDTNGGASTLDFAGELSQFTNICVGAATALDANCTDNFNVAYPAGTVGVASVGGLANFVSSSFPVIMLVSSVTTNPPPATVPEPWFTPLIGAALAGMGLVRRRKVAN